MKQQRGWTETTKYMIERNEARAQLAAANERIAVLEAALERMVRWFGQYPEWIPATDRTDDARDAVAHARAALAGVEPARSER